MKYTTYKSIHNWLGLFLLAPIILTSITGVLWMHEKRLGLKPNAAARVSDSDLQKSVSEASAKNRFTVASALGLENLEAIKSAMAEAESLWGSDDVEIEKFEIKNDPELGMIVKVVSHQAVSQAPYEFSWSIPLKEIVARKGGPKLANGQGGTDWAKVVHDLHTGKFFSSDYGFLWSDLGAAAIVLLGLTGVMLYALPILKKSANQKRRAKSTTQPTGRQSLQVPVSPALVLADGSSRNANDESMDLIRT